MNYASTVGGGAMTMVIVRGAAKKAQPQTPQVQALRQKAPAIKKRPSLKALGKAA